MSDPFTAVLFALQSLFAPAPAIDMAALQAAPSALSASAGPSWAPPQNWSLSQIETKEAGQVPRFRCELKRQGDSFAAVIVADAAFSVDYELKLHSSGANTLKVTRSDTLSVTKGSNTIDLNARLRVGKQKVMGELTLAGSGDRHATCAAT